jgi:hypothetical protein
MSELFTWRLERVKNTLLLYATSNVDTELIRSINSNIIISEKIPYFDINFPFSHYFWQQEVEQKLASAPYRKAKYNPEIVEEIREVFEKVSRKVSEEIIKAENAEEEVSISEEGIFDEKEN